MLDDGGVKTISDPSFAQEQVPGLA